MRSLILFAVAFFSFSQVEGQAKLFVNLGATLVLNPGDVADGKAFEKPNSPARLSFGASYLHNDKKRAGFVVSAGFASKGFLKQAYGPDIGYNTKIKINYCWFSPQVSLKIFNSGTRSLHFTSGPYFALAISGREKGDQYTIAGGPFEYDEKLIITDIKTNGPEKTQVSRTDLGINSSVFFRKNNLGLMLTWQKGMKNIITSIFSYTASGMLEYKNNTLDLSLLYQFGLSRHKTKKPSVKCPAVSTPVKR